ncbi:hypothetical protein OHA70_23600 [Kribbella sp. NBC_00382]
MSYSGQRGVSPSGRAADGQRTRPVTSGNRPVTVGQQRIKL